LVQSQLQESYSKIDKALKVWILHKNTAARRKASIAKLFAK
jgi:ribosomal protein S20